MFVAVRHDAGHVVGPFLSEDDAVKFAQKQRDNTRYYVRPLVESWT